MSLRPPRVRDTKARVRAPRFHLDNDLIVESKTIGTDLSFQMETENISRSGLLLQWNHKAQAPFLVNTIIEMRIDPRGAWLPRPVSCLGKVVRRAGDDVKPGGVEFGIQIIQMNDHDVDAWEHCLHRLESMGHQVEETRVRAA